MSILLIVFVNTCVWDIYNVWFTLYTNLWNWRFQHENPRSRVFIPTGCPLSVVRWAIILVCSALPCRTLYAKSFYTERREICLTHIPPVARMGTWWERWTVLAIMHRVLIVLVTGRVHCCERTPPWRRLAHPCIPWLWRKRILDPQHQSFWPIRPSSKYWASRENSRDRIWLCL